MNGIFVDTSGWYAAIDRKDRGHPESDTAGLDRPVPNAGLAYTGDGNDLCFPLPPSGPAQAG